MPMYNEFTLRFKFDLLRYFLLQTRVEHKYAQYIEWDTFLSRSLNNQMIVKNSRIQHVLLIMTLNQFYSMKHFNNTCFQILNHLQIDGIFFCDSPLTPTVCMPFAPSNFVRIFKFDLDEQYTIMSITYKDQLNLKK